MFSKKRIQQLKEVFRGFGTENMKMRRKRKEYIQKMQNHEMGTLEFAMEVPLMIYKISKKRFVKEAIDWFRFHQGNIALENALEDEEGKMEILRSFALNNLSELQEEFKLIRNRKGMDLAMNLLVDRTTETLMHVYPWLAE